MADPGDETSLRQQRTEQIVVMGEIPACIPGLAMIELPLAAIFQTVAFHACTGHQLWIFEC